MSPQVALAPIPVEVLRMLAIGDLAAAGSAMGMAMPPTVLDMQWVWNAFGHRMETRPADAFWYTQYFVVEERRIVGDVRLHEPPAPDGSVKIGYHVVPVERRRGVAVAAARALIDVATAQEEVRLIVARVNPTNQGSLAVCRHLGLRDVGEELHTHSGTMMRRLERRVQP
ncbi:GNAT family N-acetyltransferase [Aeromicrobium sp. CF3.5]|uniref:GNAT family N-acetyltransferase n=1 Tax=Aeromicrobium sp. CF3.5 TaxID=3373078 RepID=UPI003EE7768C